MTARPDAATAFREALLEAAWAIRNHQLGDKPSAVRALREAARQARAAFRPGTPETEALTVVLAAVLVMVNGPASPGPDGGSFTREFFGGSVEDYLIRELTDPDSPEFAGRSHDEASQRARSIALRAYLEGGQS